MTNRVTDELREAHALFIGEFYFDEISGVGVGIGSPENTVFGISVMGTTQAVLNRLPDTYKGFPVYKRLVGVIRAL